MSRAGAREKEASTMALPRSPIADLCTSLAAGALALGLAAAPAAAGTSALVVGVDDYSDSTALNDLKGAVADARDIAGALESLDVAPIELLLDDRASRPTVFAAWDRLIADAAAGDTIVVFFAGHGGQLAEARPGEEDDGLDEIFMLGDFDPEDSHSLILDNEFYGWWQQAAAKAVDIVFIADTCHSGGLDRTLRTRWGGTYDVSADDIPDLPAEDPDAPLPHVTRVLAALEHQVIPELLFEGEGWRGALSYVLGHGLRGAADLDRDGAIRRSELRRYVVDQVRHEAGARHRPDVRPLEGPDPVLFGAAGGPRPGARPPARPRPRR
ncbi:MAG: caspase family protein [Azospirillaceae bacterium]